MIRRENATIEPSWVFPAIGQHVYAFHHEKRNMIRVSYDFINSQWIDNKSQPVKVTHWIRK
jgi:hypothetical protein